MQWGTPFSLHGPVTLAAVTVIDSAVSRLLIPADPTLRNSMVSMCLFVCSYGFLCSWALFDLLLF